MANCDFKKVPRNSTESLIMAIVSIALSPIPHFGAVFGLTIGIIGLNHANTGIKRYNANPRIYDNKKIISAAKILSIISITINAVLVIMLIMVAKNK